MKNRKEKESYFYDDVYEKGGSNKTYFKPAEKIGAYYPTWKYAYEYIKKNNINSVVDIGCGPGHFASLFSENDNIKYTGIDFSKVAISQAKKRINNKNVTFLCEDLRGNELIDNQLYTCFEVLEHIEGDIDIIKKMNKNTSILFSVPNYDSKGHVRYFKSFNLIKERYGDFLETTLVHHIKTDLQGIIFLCYGKRK